MQKPLRSITPGSPKLAQYLNSLWHMRGLIAAFVYRDLKVQYAQTYLGLLWSVVQPVTGLIIFSVFFQRLIKIDMEVPYPVFVFTGITGWFYFTALVGQTGTSLMHNQHLIKKIQFPRLVLPIAKSISAMAELIISIIILTLLVLFNGTGLSWHILLLPIAVGCNLVAGLSVGIWLSSLTVRFRDLHHIIPFLVGFGIWLTPVFYPTTLLPSNWNMLLYFHPVANVIAFYRWIFCNTSMDWMQLLTSIGLAIVFLWIGLLYFIKNESQMAEHL